MKCLIVSGGEFTKVKLTCKYDLVIACDKGYLYANKLGINPNIIIGDFDSSKIPKKNVSILKFDSIKDDTDTILAIKYALKNGCKDIDIICALGKRIDHTLANINILKFISENNGVGRILSADAELKVLNKGTHKIKKKLNSYLSILSLSENSKISFIKGTKYDVKNITLKNSFPLGISNEFKNDLAKIKIDKGIVLALIVKKD